MANEVEERGGAALAKVVALGTFTLAMYILLFKYEDLVLSITAKGGWAFILPVGIAFVFSAFHGAFTGRFWDYIGIKAKK